MTEHRQLDNILKLLKRGKWELEGEEILAFFYSYKWLVEKLQSLSIPQPLVKEENKIDPPKKKGRKK